MFCADDLVCLRVGLYHCCFWVGAHKLLALCAGVLADLDTLMLFQTEEKQRIKKGYS